MVETFYIYFCYMIAQEFAQSYLCCSNEPPPNYMQNVVHVNVTAHMTGGTSHGRFSVIYFKTHALTRFVLVEETLQKA